MKLIKVKAELLKWFNPRLAIKRYCLKANPDARLFLPSVNSQIEFMVLLPSYKRAEILGERVWSVEARHAMYEKDKWDGLVPEDLWEFEYLLKYADFVGYSANLPYNRKKYPAFYLLIEAMNNNTAFAEKLAKDYVQVAEDVGPELLVENLDTEAFDAFLRVFVAEHKEKALPFMLVASGNKDLYRNLFISILSRDPEYLAEIKEMIRDL